MQQIHRKAHPAQEQQVSAAKQSLQRGAQKHAQGDELQSDAAGESRKVWECGQNRPHHIQHNPGPSHPLGISLGERCDSEPKEDHDP